MRILSGIFLLILALLAIIFACLNAETVSLNYYLGTKEFPLSLLLVMVLFIGAVLGLLVGLFLYLKAKNHSRRLQQRLKVAEAEVANMRSLPLKDAH